VTWLSGAAEKKLPPSAKKTVASPRPIASIAPITSCPCRLGGSKPNAAPSRSRKMGSSRSKMPIVRSPCTLECPRTGQAPAPGLPTAPRSSSVLTTSWIAPTALRCCVRPIAQQINLADRCRVTEAARALTVHPNTLRQRLERIETLTGLDLARADLLAHELAIKLARLRPQP
jgi:hypothetical protein